MQGGLTLRSVINFISFCLPNYFWIKIIHNKQIYILAEPKYLSSAIYEKSNLNLVNLLEPQQN